MSVATASNRALILFCDDVFPPSGPIGYVALLKTDLLSGVSVTVSAVVDEITLSSHGLVTGSRIRVASSGTIPSPLLATQDYYAIVTSGAAFKVAATLADAIAGAAINLSDSGSGSIAVTEQPLNSSDPLDVLLNKELTHPSWTARAPIDGVGAATIVAGAAEKSPVFIDVTNDNPADLVYGYVIILIGSAVTNVIGSTTGIIGELLSIEDPPQLVGEGESKSIEIKLRARTA